MTSFFFSFVFTINTEKSIFHFPNIILKEKIVAGHSFQNFFPLCNIQNYQMTDISLELSIFMLFRLNNIQSNSDIFMEQAIDRESLFG